MGITAENLAREYHISREAQDSSPCQPPESGRGDR